MSPEAVQISDGEIRSALSVYGLSSSDEQCAKIRAYIELLLRWNRSVSLTTITTPLEIAERHFGESILISKLLSVENCRLVDIGTGAGFPGLALKTFEASIELILIESNKRKCAFLAEVVRTLELSSVEIRPERFEDIRSEGIDANIVTCRAVGGLKPLLQWSRRALACRGHVVLWLGAEDSNRISGHPGWIWQPAVKIPESQRRFILIGRPTETRC